MKGAAEEDLALRHLLAQGMKLAIHSGYLAARAGRIPKKLYATASSPETGLVEAR